MEINVLGRIDKIIEQMRAYKNDRQKEKYAEVEYILKTYDELEKRKKNNFNDKCLDTLSQKLHDHIEKFQF